ncbi:hypothetical protein U9M48_009227, partial [Paspalum notatum var. saurae]
GRLVAVLRAHAAGNGRSGFLSTAVAKARRFLRAHAAVRRRPPVSSRRPPVSSRPTSPTSPSPCSSAPRPLARSRAESPRLSSIFLSSDRNRIQLLAPQVDAPPTPGRAGGFPWNFLRRKWRGAQGQIRRPASRNRTLGDLLVQAARGVLESDYTSAKSSTQT